MGEVYTLHSGVWEGVGSSYKECDGCYTIRKLLEERGCPAAFTGLAEALSDRDELRARFLEQKAARRTGALRRSENMLKLTWKRTVSDGLTIWKNTGKDAGQFEIRNNYEPHPDGLNWSIFRWDRHQGSETSAVKAKAFAEQLYNHD